MIPPSFDVYPCCLSGLPAWISCRVSCPRIISEAAPSQRFDACRTVTRLVGYLQMGERCHRR